MKITKIDPNDGTENTMDIPVSHEQLADWQGGTLIQKAMPDLSADQREFLMTGIIPGNFPGDEDQPDVLITITVPGSNVVKTVGCKVPDLGPLNELYKFIELGGGPNIKEFYAGHVARMCNEVFNVDIPIGELLKAEGENNEEI